MKNILIIVAMLFGLLWVISSSSCISNKKNAEMSFGINFVKGSSREELIDFTKDIKTYYPKITIKNIMTDEDSFNAAVKLHNIKPEKIEEYRQMLADNYNSLPTATIDIQASRNDIGNEKEFGVFVTKELDKYRSLKINQFYGSASSVEDIFNRGRIEDSFCRSPLSIPIFITRLIK